MSTSGSSRYDYPPEKQDDSVSYRPNPGSQSIGEREIDVNDVPPPAYDHIRSPQYQYPNDELESFKHADKSGQGSSQGLYALSPPQGAEPVFSPGTHASPVSPVPSEGSSASSPTSASGETSKDRLKKFAPGKSVRELLTPPPPSFGRTPSRSLRLESFQPTVLVSLSSRLEDGFLAVPPPYVGQAHPFSTHDVTEDDWNLFLGHIKAAGALSPMNRMVAYGAPILAVGFPVGILVAKGIEKHMKQKKGGPVGELVSQWNYYFFHPRCMHATLAQGAKTYTGTDNVPPDMVGNKGKSSASVRPYDASSSDESDHGGNSSGTVSGSLGSRKGSKKRKSAERGGSNAPSEFKDSKKERWRLILSYNPPLDIL